MYLCNANKNKDIMIKINNIAVYNLKTGGYAIKCNINGKPQEPKKLSREDANNLDKLNRQDLAIKYFGL